MVRIAAISNRRSVGFEIASDLGIEISQVTVVQILRLKHGCPSFTLHGECRDLAFITLQCCLGMADINSNTVGNHGPKLGNRRRGHHERGLIT